MFLILGYAELLKCLPFLVKWEHNSFGIHHEQAYQHFRETCSHPIDNAQLSRPHRPQPNLLTNR